MIGTYTNTIDNIKGAYRIAQKEYAEHPDIKARMATVNGEGTNTLINQSLQLPALSQGIIETPFEGFPMRTLLNYISSPNNPTVVIPREMGSSRAVVMRVAEGAEIPLNFAPLTSITCQCYKIAEGFIVSKELQQFQQIGVIEQKARHLAFKMKHTENVDVITAIGAGVPAPNILATTGVSLGQDGTVFVFPGTIGQFDITAGIRILQENFKGTTGKMVLMVNPAGLQGLNRLPMYKSWMQYGEEGYKLGFRGTIEAIDVIYSNDVPAGVAYLISTDPLSYPTGQYTPVGWFIESRPITNVNWDRPDLDSYMVYSTHMYTTCIGYGEGIVQLTYMSYS